ncbi:hypothetical protein RFI_28272, partial [Reticulomyxa filosa]
THISKQVLPLPASSTSQVGPNAEASEEAHNNVVGRHKKRGGAHRSKTGDSANGGAGTGVGANSGGGGGDASQKKNGTFPSTVNTMNEDGTPSMAKFAELWTTQPKLAEAHETDDGYDAESEEGNGFDNEVESSLKNTHTDGSHFDGLRSPKLVRDLHFQSRVKMCFVWDGKAINGVPFNLQSARTVQFLVKYCFDDDEKGIEVSEKLVTMPIESSLKDIWAIINKEFPGTDLIEEPVFTLLTDLSEDRPDVVYFGNV